MIYNIVQNNKVIDIVDSQEGIESLKIKYPNIDESLPDVFCVGQDVREYDRVNEKFKSLQEIVDAGIKTIPSGFKIEDNEFIPMSALEKIKEGLEEAPKGMKYDSQTDSLIQMTTKELYNEGLISLEDLKEVKHQQIKQDFDDFEMNGTKGGIMSTTLGIRIENAKSDIEKIQAIINDYNILNIPVPTFYKGSTEIKMSVMHTDFENVYREFRNLYMSEWQRKQDRYTALEAATTSEEIEAI